MEWLDLLFAAAPGKAEREEVDDDRESELKAGHRVEPVATNIAGRVNEKDQQEASRQRQIRDGDLPPGLRVEISTGNAHPNSASRILDKRECG